MSDDENIPDIELPSPLETSLYAIKSQGIVVLHPGLTVSVFLEKLREGHMPASLRNIIQEVEAECENSEGIVKLWHEANNFVPATFEDLVALYRVCCGLMLLPCEIQMTHLKMGVIHKVFRQTSRDWHVCPVKIHIVSKELYPLLEDARNLMYFIRIVASVSQMAFYVSCCLAFSLLFSIVNKEIKMFRMHNFQTIIDTLKEINIKEMKDKTNDFYSLLDTVVFLLNVIVFREPDDMACKYYNEFFEKTPEQIKELLKWSENVQRVFQPRSGNENCDAMMITELIDFDFIQRLSGFLEEQELELI